MVKYHFLLYYLTHYFKERYLIKFDRTNHCYLCLRAVNGRVLKHGDSFTIIKTSNHCWRLIYLDWSRGISEYISFKYLFELVDYIDLLHQRRIIYESYSSGNYRNKSSKRNDK